MHDHRPIIEERARRHLDERIRPAELETLVPLEVEAFHVTDEGGPAGQGEPVSREQGLAADYEPFAVGDAWGPAWGTTWFHLTATVPQEARGEHLEAVLDLGWKGAGAGFQAEGLVFRPDGSIVKAINPRNAWIPVELDEDGRFEVYVEAAANPEIISGGFFPQPRGEKSTAGPAPINHLERAELCRVQDEVRELIADIVTLDGLARQLPSDNTRAWQLLRALDSAMDELNLTDVPGTAAAARERLAGVLADQAPDTAFRVSAIGHAHIDSAWLWPVRETKRKAARTAANQLNLIEDGPSLEDGGMLFSLPAAQHWAWLEREYPDLFERLKAQVAAGRMVPVGGMWVEPDANLPGGEAMCRQLTFGVRYYRDKLGFRCRDVWLPDSFGYSGALPQLAKLAGMKYFLTQKISWNQVDKFPHHTFWWEGIDGTRIFTHFPSTDTYNSDLSAGELAHAERNFADKGHANSSMTPFGFGDGGGGPTREMLAQAKRVANLAGTPRVVIETPQSFFAHAEATHTDPSVWVGELYLELHRGTFTTQADTKAGNRRNEHLLREAELWCTTAAARGLMDYPYDELHDVWERVLLNQFHDILPGSSIAWVHRQTAQEHAEDTATLEAIIERAIGALSADGPRQPVVFDAGLALSATPAEDEGASVTLDSGEAHVLTNEHLRVAVDGRGVITSLFDLDHDREVLPPGTVGNLLQLHNDFPNRWDAWDVDPFYRNSVTDLVDADAVSAEVVDGAARVRVERSFSGSTAVQTITLRPGAAFVDVEVDVDWHEHEKFLKLAWPLDVHSAEARFETQMGHVVRATHENTSWDHYRFEVNAHRWVHVGEPGYGVAIANLRTYGWDVTRSARAGGATYTTVRASLLRGAQAPDPRADEGRHHFGFRLVPGASVLDAVHAGYAVNVPTRAVEAAPVDALVQAEGAVIEAVKLADDRSGDVVVRLYEPLGSRSKATVSTSFDLADARETDLLEEDFDGDVAASAVAGWEGGSVNLTLRPFQVVTLRMKAKEQ